MCCMCLNFGLMMKEGLFKENIDGEVLEWVYKCMLVCCEQCKILMVIFDGVFVDDFILLVNFVNYLEKYLCDVIDMIEKQCVVELIVIGIGYDVICYY